MGANHSIEQTVAVDPVALGQTRVVLADMHITGVAGSYYNVRHFGKPERAAVLRTLGKQLQLSPTHVLIESISQSNAQGLVQVGFVTTSTSTTAIIEKLRNAAGPTGAKP